MRVGYTAAEDYLIERKRLYSEGKCDDVVVIGDGSNYFKCFIQFLEKNKGNEIIVTGIEGINIFLPNYVDIYTKVTEYEITLTFLDKELSSDNDYLFFLSQIARRERAIRSKRTIKGLDRAKIEGKIGGRPSINPDLINQIKYLFANQSKSLREIADITGVSLGTVHKYTSEDKR